MLRIFVALLLCACGGENPTPPPPRVVPPPSPAPARIIVPQVGLSGARSIAWHPDGRHLAVGAHDVIVFDAIDGSVTAELAMGSSRDASVAWSGDGRLLVALSAEVLRIWDVESGSMRSVALEAGSETGAPPLSVSRDGSLIAGALLEGIRIWNADGTERSRVPESGSAPDEMALSPDAHRVAWFGWGLRLEELRDGSPSGEPNLVYSDGQVPWIAPPPSRALAWDAQSLGLALATVETARVFRPGANGYSRDEGKVLDSGLDAPRRLSPTDQLPAIGVAFADGDELCMLAEHRSVRWTIAPDAEPRVVPLAVPAGREHALATARAISGGCRLAASGAYEGSIDVFDFANGQLQRSLTGRGLVRAVSGPDGRLGWTDQHGAHVIGPEGHRFFAGAVDIGFAADGSPWRRLRGHDRGAIEIDGRPPAEVSGWGYISRAPDWRTIEIDDLDDIRVVDTASGAMTVVRGSLERNDSFAPDRFLLRQGGRRVVFDLHTQVSTPVVISRRHGPDAGVRLSPDGSLIGVADREELTLYDARTMRELRREPGGGSELAWTAAGEPVTWAGIEETGRQVILHGSERRAIELAAPAVWAELSPQRTHLAVTTEAGRVSVIDLVRGTSLGSVSLGARASIVWSPDGRRLAATAHETSHVLELDSLHELEQLHPSVAQWLTPSMVVIHDYERVRLHRIGGGELTLLSFEDGSFMATTAERCALDARAAAHVRARRGPGLFAPLEPFGATGDPVALVREFLAR